MIFAIFFGPIGFFGMPEKPKPGSEGTITSKLSSLFPPNLSGWASFSIILKNSIKLPGQPCKINSGLGFFPLPFSFIK